MLGINLYTTITIPAWFITCKYIEKPLQQWFARSLQEISTTRTETRKSKAGFAVSEEL
jgi:hypothetical protein